MDLDPDPQKCVANAFANDQKANDKTHEYPTHS